ncbi:hypothetical protein CL621_04790 [archaeon]|nr:hypothetical protein [archaeon]
MTWKIKQLAKPKLNKIVLIEGLPGVGNVGKIALDFIINNLKAKKLFQIYSYSFPHSVFINEENLVELPVIEIYYKNMKGKSFLFLTGDIQPLDEESCYEFCDQILDIFQKFKGKEIITLGGIALQKVPKLPKIFYTANKKEMISKYKVKGINNNLFGVVGPIIGVSGLLLGLAGQREISAVSFLAETFAHPTYLGVKGAKEIVKTLNKLFNFKLDTKQLGKEVSPVEKEIKSKVKELEKVSKQIKQYNTKDTNYIG